MSTVARFRSRNGCCICKTKRSKSRFTDSSKFAAYLIPCFGLNNPRHGDICQACSMCVRRYRSLPPDSTQNWAHVVDSRYVPGKNSVQNRLRRIRQRIVSHSEGELLITFNEDSGYIPDTSDDENTTAANPIRVMSDNEDFNDNGPNRRRDTLRMLITGNMDEINDGRMPFISALLAALADPARDRNTDNPRVIYLELTDNSDS